MSSAIVYGALVGFFVLLSAIAYGFVMLANVVNAGIDEILSEMRKRQ